MDFHVVVSFYLFPARVVYLTYDHMVLYECTRLVDDKCPPEFTYLDIYSREIRAPDPANQATMIQVVVDMCMDVPEFVQARHAGKQSRSREVFFSCQLGCHVLYILR